MTTERDERSDKKLCELLRIYVNKLPWVQPNPLLDATNELEHRLTDLRARLAEAEQRWRSRCDADGIWQSQMERENGKLQARCEELESQLAAQAKVVEAARVMLAKTENYFEEHGAEHSDPECPEDDTCECALVVELNAAFRSLKDALTAEPAAESGAGTEEP